MKKILLALLLLAVVAGGWYLLGHRAAPASEAEAARPAAKVVTAVLREQTIAQTLRAFGVIADGPSGDHVLAAPYDCQVRKIFVGAGAPVAAGEVLLEIGPSPDSQLTLDSARSALALAEQVLAATQERYDLKLATKQDLLGAQQAAGEVRLKAASLGARGLGGDGRITAPAPGVVSKLEVFSGSLVAAGTPLVTVSTGGRLEAHLGVEASDLTAVAAGQPVELESSHRPGAEKILTSVLSVGAEIDAATGAVQVRAAVPADAALLHGEHVSAAIGIRKKDHALVVPRSAVLPEGDKHVLFTVKAGKVVKYEVTIGISTDDLFEVIDGGLKAGDVVVTLGNYELEDGMAVQPATAEAKP